jgi:ribosome-associated translation inhibitor RaiA
VYVAKAQEADHRSALDVVIARLKRQLLDEKKPPRPRRARRSAPKISGPR